MNLPAEGTNTGADFRPCVLRCVLAPKTQDLHAARREAAVLSTDGHRHETNRAVPKKELEPSAKKSFVLQFLRSFLALVLVRFTMSLLAVDAAILDKSACRTVLEFASVARRFPAIGAGIIICD